MKTVEPLTLSGLLELLGYVHDEFVSIGHSNGDGQFRTAVGQPGNAEAYVSKLPAGADVFFGIHAVKGPARKDAGRGKAADVIRVTALAADLDVKAGACPDIETAHAIVGELSAMLGTRPSAITCSGNGLHPYWPVSDGTRDSCNIEALLRRWGRLVALVAEKHGARVDSVFDLPRMLRVPGTLNTKASNKIRVTTYADSGGPLTVAEIDERLCEYGICEEPGDSRSAEQISNPAGWQFADATCQYVQELIDGISTDGPVSGNGRHQWVLKQAVRLACAWRLACITQPDYRRAQALLEASSRAISMGRRRDPKSKETQRISVRNTETSL